MRTAEAWRRVLVLLGVCVPFAAADSSNTCTDQDLYRNIAIVCAICAGVLFVVVLIMTFFMKKILDHQRISRQLVADRNNLRFSSARSTSDVNSAPSQATTSVTLTTKSFAAHGRAAPSERSVTTNLGRALSGYDQSIDAILGAPTLLSGSRAAAAAGTDDFVGTGLNSVELKQQRAAARRANVRRKSSFNSEDLEEDEQLPVSQGVAIVSQDSYLNRTSPRRSGEPQESRFTVNPLHRDKSGSQASLDFEWPDVDSDSDAGGDEVDLAVRRDIRNKKTGSASDYGYTDFAPVPPGTVLESGQSAMPGLSGEEAALAAFDEAINALDETADNGDRGDHNDEVEEI